MKHKIDVPEGCRVVSVETTDEMVVVKFEKEEPEFKENDIVTCETEGIKWVAIFKEKIDAFSFRAKALYTTVISQSDWCSYGERCRHATDSEKQLLLDRMHGPGYDWDAEKCEVVPYRWRPNSGEEYVYPAPITPDLYLTTYWLDLDEEDIHRWKNGLVFKVGEEEKAIEKAKKMLEA